ncbi:MAG TPA: phage head closure protein [Microvirga sp.]|jgi:SPP1 family predicted phage head-tail adaptor|nr:phage head closure protein [Microvirga sp.]
MPSAGDLVERVSFAKRQDTTDEYGGVKADWQPQFSRSAMFIMRPGSESVMAARLEGRQPLTIVVRFDSQTKAIGLDWQVTDVRTGKTYAIRAAEDMDRKRQWLSLVCEGGALA